ncbi:MAG: hypothetical protein IKN24_04985 [Lachnospiraceae bacterium]|nr:hypothetical protein [Lachnospiraceae bacterium]
MRDNKKQFIFLLLVMILTFTLTSCNSRMANSSSTESFPDGESKKENEEIGVTTSEHSVVETDKPEPTSSATPQVVKKTDHMKILGICVDDSYKDKNNGSLKLVYLFYEFIATDKNLSIDSVYTKMTIGEKNTYESKHYSTTASALVYMPNFYYSTYIENVYLGNSINVAATFYIPSGDLVKGKTITISDSQIPDCNKILFYTDDIQFFNNPEDIAKKIDSKGYNETIKAFKEANSNTTQLVKSLVNGYYWWCYVNNIYYEIEFWEDNNFEVRTGLGTTAQGKYSVRNGYLFCTYSTNGRELRIPYQLVNGDIELQFADALDAFDGV